MGAMQAATAGGLIDDVVAAVDIHRFAGDEPRRVMSEKRGRRPDIVDAHQAAGGGFRLRLFKQCLSAAIAITGLKLRAVTGPRSGSPLRWPGERVPRPGTRPHTMQAGRSESARLLRRAHR